MIHLNSNLFARRCRGSRSLGRVVRLAALTVPTTATAFALLIGFADRVSAQTLSFLPAADTSILLRVQSPLELRSNGRGSIFTGRTALTHDVVQRGLIRFDISAIPCGSIVTGVELRMTLLRAAGGGARSSTVSLHRLTESWGEGNSSAFGGDGAPSVAPDANWIERFHPGVLWTTPGGEFVAVPSASVAVGEERIVLWSSTPGLIADVSQWVRDGSSNFGWLLHNDESVSASARKLASREYPDVEDRPMLRITYSAGCTADLPIGGSCPDGIVDGSDFIAFINGFVTGDPAVDPVADINADGIVDGNDFVAFINAFAAGC